MIRLVVCDLDETLVLDDGSVSDRNVQAVKRLADAGVQFAICSGRAFYSVRPLLRLLDLDHAGCYTVSFNGGCVTENGSEKVLFSRFLARERIVPLFEYGLAHGECMQLYTDRSCYVVNVFPSQLDYTRGREVLVHAGAHLLSVLDEKTVKLLFAREDLDHLAALKESVAHLSKGLATTFSSNRYLEFMAADVSKALGVKALCQILGLSADSVLAIGDNTNDLEMLKWAGHGACVNNGVAAVKDVCEYVSSRSCYEDGVAEILAHYGLIDWNGLERKDMQ